MKLAKSEPELCNFTFSMSRHEEEDDLEDYESEEPTMHRWSTEGFLTGYPSASPNIECVELQDMKPLKAMGDVDHSRRGKNAKKKKEAKKPPSVPYYKLFSFADRYDLVLIFLGATGACVHGVAIPIFFIFFGKLINAFGEYFANPEKMSAEVAKVRFDPCQLNLLLLRY